MSKLTIVEEQSELELITETPTLILIEEPTSVVIESGTTVEIFHDVTAVIELISQGPQGVKGATGDPGPPGSDGGAQAVQFTKIAGASLSGHRMVRPGLDGRAIYADNLTSADVNTPLWLTLGAAVEDADIEVAAFGNVEESSWAWSSGPVYLGLNGNLTQTPPVAPAFSVIVGYSYGPTVLFVDRQTPTVLA